MRIALLLDHPHAHGVALRAALEGYASKLLLLGPGTGQQAAPNPSGGPAQPEQGGWTILKLASFRPDLILAEGFGAATFQAALYRSLRPRTRLLVWAPRALPPFAPVRFLAGRVDGVLAEGEAVADAIEQLNFPLIRTVAAPLAEGLAAFAACPLTRTHEQAHRLVYVGDLAPQTGIADFLMSATLWAERHLERSIDIWWAGDGDLRGILEAQPLPANVAQAFLGKLEEAELASVFARCGLLIVPALMRGQPHVARQALAAGLPILASTHGRGMRELVQEGHNGWLFDPLQPGAVLAALDRALATRPDELDRMRAAARQSVRPPAESAGESRIGWALRAVLHELTPAVPAVAGA